MALINCALIGRVSKPAQEPSHISLLVGISDTIVITTQVLKEKETHWPEVP